MNSVIFVNMVHKGEIIEKAVRKSGISVSELSKRLKKSRRYVYNLFEKPNISVDVILQVAKIIHHDFSDEIMEIVQVKYSVSENSYVLKEEPNIEYNTAEYWKNKYLEILEKHNKLLSEHLSLIKKKTK